MQVGVRQPAREPEPPPIQLPAPECWAKALHSSSSKLHFLDALPFLSVSMPAPEQNTNPITQKAHGPKVKAASVEVRMGSQSEAGAAAVVWGGFPAVGTRQVFCMYILAFGREEGHLHWQKRRNSHSGMYDTCHTIMWLLSALESTGFTWVVSPAFSSVSSSSPSPEERK